MLRTLRACHQPIGPETLWGRRHEASASKSRRGALAPAERCQRSHGRAKRIRLKQSFSVLKELEDISFSLYSSSRRTPKPKILKPCFSSVKKHVFALKLHMSLAAALISHSQDLPPTAPPGGAAGLAGARAGRYFSSLGLERALF
jgi:hypothetical protein